MSYNFDANKFLSPISKNIPPSGIRKFFDIVNEMKDAISLGVGEPDFVTPWHIRSSAIEALKKGHTYYTSNWGLMELRCEIAKNIYEKLNVSYEPENEILVTVGGSEGLDNAIRALVSPGDEVIIPEPSFVCYKPCVTLMNGVPVPVVTKMENNFKLKKEELLNAITEKTKVLILSYPNNPTGAIMEYDDLKEIVDVLKDKDIIVISDEIYSELTYGKKHVSITQFEEMKDRTILISGFSKAYAMTGWRLGYVCGHKDIMNTITKIHQYAIMSSPTMSQYAAIEALKNGEEDIVSMKNEYDKRRRFLVDRLNKMGLDCFWPEGAFYVFPSIKSTGMSSTTFCEELLKSQKVAIIPGNAFGDSGEGFVRISYAYSLDKLKEALDRIEKFM